MAARTGSTSSRRKEVKKTPAKTSKITILYQNLYTSSDRQKRVFLEYKLFLQLLGRPLLYLLLGSGLFLVFFLAQAKHFFGFGLKFFKESLSESLSKIGEIDIRFPQVKIKKPKINFFPIPQPKIYIPQIPFKLILFLSCLFLFSASIVAFYDFVLKDLPQPQNLISRDQAVTTKIYDRNGQLLYKIYNNENRSLVQLPEIPLFVRQATIAVEDAEFYQHHGFSLRGISRSLYKNFSSGKLSGGSTITQQLVKNALLTPERTWQRKAKEFILSVWVEATFSKDEILQMYLNEVSYGGSAYGIEEASQLYFGKSVKEINLSEAALLAGLPASPTTYSPFGASPEFAKKRQEKVLQRMAEEGYLTQSESDKAKLEKLNFIPQRSNILAPHFVMYIKDLLVKEYGEKMVESGGLEVKTSLDLNVQQMAEKAVSEELAKLKGLNVTNGASLVTNPKTGEILAMVGSKDYFDLAHDGNYNVTTALRQPGSSIKPVNYAVALARGFTPATVIPDTPITYHIPGQEPYTPKNYDSRYHGNVTLRTALGSSYNVPAVKVLSAVGLSNMLEQGKRMGITTWEDNSRFGLSLTLGGGEVKMVDMAVVYGTFANQGNKVDLHPILEVKDYHGKTLEKFNSQPNRFQIDNLKVLSPSIAYIITDILTDNGARTPAFGPNSQLVIPNHTVAVKTGTTNNLKDNWTIGYTPSVLVAVWVGNNDNSPMSYVASGVTGASPIWNKIMNQMLINKTEEIFPIPEGLIKATICTITGTLPCNGCPTREEWFLPGTEPINHCTQDQLTPTPETIESVNDQRREQATEDRNTKKPRRERTLGFSNLASIFD